MKTVKQLVEAYGPLFDRGAEMEGIKLSRDEFSLGCNLATLRQYPTLESYQDAFPVGQDFHTGKWGFGRHAEGLNLQTCQYPAKLYAEKVRDSEYARIEAAVRR